MEIENRIEGGTFCADKNINIIYPDGKRSRLVTSSGIPVCPDVYKFSAQGEKLGFSLTFPPLRPGTGWIDLIEDCNDNCFSFYGIALDNSLNARIDEAFSLAERKESKEALKSFISIIDDIDDQNNGIEGLLFINIIKLSILTGDDKGAESWYKRFRISDSPRLSSYLKYLNEQGVRY
jgi:hypothetical protein